jgi:predicted ferric reductase
MKKGKLLIAAITAVTIVCWLVTRPIDHISGLLQISQLLGALALAGFACTLFISTRHPILDRLFGGVDKAYIMHKWLGIGSGCLIFFHLIILNIEHRSLAAMASPLTMTQFGRIGFPSMLMFIVLILIALFAKKINYEMWKTIHKFVALPYTIGLIHYYGSSYYGAFSFSPFSIWMNILNLFGIISAFYSIFIYEKTAFSFKYKVSTVKAVANKTIEITGEAIGKHISYQPGQFTFFKIPNGSARFPSHPFTISTAPHSSIIQFSIKSLGDHTAKLISAIKIDDVFSITAPHGMFDYTKGGKHQVWIAGGIGITPFRSFYGANIPEDFSIDFFYAYTGDDGAYLEELRAIDKSNLRVHLIDSKEQGHLTAEKIKEKLNTASPVDIYFCGPKPMRESLSKGFKSSGVQVQGFHFEEFKFGR